MKKILSLIIVFCFLFVPFIIYADSSTYTSYNANTMVEIWTTSSRHGFVQCSVDTRAIYLHSGDSYNVYFVSLTNGSYKYGSRDLGVYPDWDNTYPNTLDSGVYNGSEYYYYYI